MSDWRDLIRSSDAGKIFPEAAARVIEQGDARIAGAHVEADASVCDPEHLPSEGESGTL